MRSKLFLSDTEGNKDMLKEVSLPETYATYIRNSIEDHRKSLDLNGIIVLDGYHNPETAQEVNSEKQAFLTHFNERAYLAHRIDHVWKEVPLISVKNGQFELGKSYDNHNQAFLEKYFPDHNNRNISVLFNWFLTNVFDSAQLNKYENSLGLEGNSFLEIDPFDIAVMVQKYGNNMDPRGIGLIKDILTKYNYFDFESPNYISYMIQPSGEFSLRVIGSENLTPSQFLMRDFITEDTNLPEIFDGYDYFFEISRFTAYHAMQFRDTTHVMTEIGKLLFLFKQQFSEQNAIFFAEMSEKNPIVRFFMSNHKFLQEARQGIISTIKNRGYDQASLPQLNPLAALKHLQSLIQFNFKAE